MKITVKLFFMAILVGFVLFQPFLLVQSHTQGSLQKISDSAGNFYISREKNNSSLMIFTENSQVYNITLKINVTSGDGLLVTYDNENFVRLSERVKSLTYQVLNFNASYVELGIINFDFVSGTYELTVGNKITATGEPDISPAATLLGFIGDLFPLLIGGVFAGDSKTSIFVSREVFAKEAIQLLFQVFKSCISSGRDWSNLT